MQCRAENAHGCGSCLQSASGHQAGAGTGEFLGFV